MDQLKVAGAILKKYHFWFLCGLVLVAGLLGWKMATASISTEFQQFSGDVNRRVSEQQGIVQQNPDHPNDGVIEGFAALNDQLRKNVYDVWKRLYEKQREEVLFWPDDLRPDFLQFISTQKFGAPIPIEYRERYQNYVRERFGELSSIVEARAVPLSSTVGQEGELYNPMALRAPSREPIDGEEAEEEHYLVEWSQQNQEQLQSKLVWDEPPSSIKMWITQEDLWVYENLLRIIAQTNRGATAQHNAKVSVIHALEAGKEAAQNSNSQGRIPLLEVAGAEEAEPEAEEAVDPFTIPEQLEEELKDDPTNHEKRDRVLLAGRYLDGQGKPMPLPEDPSKFVAVDEEFKRVPVRLVLQMDPREIPRLLVECANATLPVEVQQVRVNADGVTDSSDEPGGRTRSTRPARRGSESEPSVGSDLRQVAQVKVVIQGIIYIFNPPNLEKLGIDPQQLATATPAAEAPAEPQAAAGAEAEGEQAAPPADETQPQAPAAEPAEPASEPAETPQPVAAESS